MRTSLFQGSAAIDSPKVVLVLKDCASEVACVWPAGGGYTLDQRAPRDFKPVDAGALLHRPGAGVAPDHVLDGFLPAKPGDIGEFVAENGRVRLRKTTRP